MDGDLTAREKEMFSKRLRELREEHHIKRRVMDGLCGLREKAIADYEDGVCYPNFESLMKISQFLMVSIDYMVGKSEEK